jgi:hypothetical protein
LYLVSQDRSHLPEIPGTAIDNDCSRPDAHRIRSKTEEKVEEIVLVAQLKTGGVHRSHVDECACALNGGIASSPRAHGNENVLEKTLRD